jgi:hypothetical protein
MSPALSKLIHSGIFIDQEKVFTEAGNKSKVALVRKISVFLFLTGVHFSVD